MLTPMATLQELEVIYERLRGGEGDEVQIIVELLRNEIVRRRAAGRGRTSLMDRREQNRVAQAKWRKQKGKKLLTNKQK